MHPSAAMAVSIIPQETEKSSGGSGGEWGRGRTLAPRWRWAPCRAAAPRPPRGPCCGTRGGREGEREKGGGGGSIRVLGPRPKSRREPRPEPAGYSDRATSLLMNPLGNTRGRTRSRRE